MPAIRKGDSFPRFFVQARLHLPGHGGRRSEHICLSRWPLHLLQLARLMC